MSHTIELSDEQYEILREAAAARGESPDTVVAALIVELRTTQSQPRYYETDDFLRHLGASEEEIAELNREIAEETAREAGANADA
ncbi:MAG TPA: hypothetical protein VKT52_13630 [Ktedonobacterales bacterium]|nr:hypothetical protein [Ktedonobacterales bacterium]